MDVIRPANRGDVSALGREFLLQVVIGQWFMVFASFLIMMTAGVTYMFSLYSKDIKSIFGYDQTILNLISFCKDLGANVGVLSGVINEFMPPWVVLSIGAVLNLFGYLMIWLILTKRIGTPQLWQICFYLCIRMNSQTFSNTTSLIPCVKNFPQNRGIVLGILKGYAGWLPTVISLVVLPSIRYTKVIRQTNEVKVFNNVMYISLGLAGFLMILIIVQQKVAFTHNEYVGSAVAMIILLFLPLVVVFAIEFKLWKSKELEINEATPSVSAQSPISKTTNSLTEEDQPASWWKNVFSPPKRGDDYTILQSICSLNMITFLIVAMCRFGGSLTAIDNLSQIGSSYGYPMVSIRTCVSLLSTWNYLGRVAAGCVSDIVLQKYKFPCPLPAHSDPHSIMCRSSYHSS
ncbi:hypothetical protein FH972_014048 [Carpinus fangiana]|uniref:Nodulin-like domain-containing protein n=1 Tax=Carpinus fangiana TaxID=176857 RepID=A0A5N6RBZ1_9ROSI|nr:hypothetical protein FH972_014048 [Carpinus fangiana]